MRSLLLLLVFISAALAANQYHQADIEDNEFAEFEDFDDEGEVIEDDSDGSIEDQPKVKVMMAPEAEEATGSSDDVTVEDDEDEFDHFQDEDEFEGFDKERPLRSKAGDKPQELKITPVPLHLRTKWDNFHLEMLLLAGVAVYVLNFLAGKSKNSRLAQNWFTHHKALLESQFALVGDDGTSTEPQSGVLMKDYENAYSLWCSGRVCCDGMLVTLKLLKRQDLVSTISRFFKPASDQIIIKVDLAVDELEKFVFCVANKKVASKMQKDLVDLSSFTELKKVVADKLPPSLHLLNEVTEASSTVMDSKFVQTMAKYESLIEYIHISDQYSGAKPTDDSQEAKIEPSPALLACFNLPSKGPGAGDMTLVEPLMKLIFHILNRLPHIHLSREAREKTRKNRSRMQELVQKAAHTQRAEAAQIRKEERKRAEKDRIMAETDPEKQRRLEEKSNKKDARKKQPKMKTMKVKMS
ncbi:hypothetical protein CAPTEDRAFT_178720 [Capitella teleta]|uniref:PAT complex subunit CCDC47 n=1 Tax=Capitella teleta TaxID=283909 RepID=R7TJ98_CAPTE|nr:hypothetical protein CAPTEDRAFT_178720 [Capitella teleta]|eukprot:ELT91180.1 hypothetical protein CAPTEDRAFT_178720 [Capitella teleta]